MKSIFKSVVLHKILVIFVVGFISRGFVNSMFDINVFKEYTDFISLLYYGLMACFTSYINCLPSISFNIFNINIIRGAAKSFGENVVLSDNKASVGMFTDNTSKPVVQNKNNLIYNYTRRPSAAIIGLYSNQDGGRGVDYITKHSLGNKLRGRMLWYSIIQFTDKYSTYKEYIGSFDPRHNISMVDEIKRDVLKRNK